MASSNRHWPSMFKSKPCNTHQWQHEITPSLMSSGCHRTPYTSVGGCEERAPEPKPRWNPKPEQIRILEAIFNSGMVNPPRDEIRKIRAQLQEYGQVGDANVFYWFQNRKSRSKHKLRHLAQQQSSISTPPLTITSSMTTATATAITTTPSSSSSDKSSPTPTGSSKRIFSLNSPSVVRDHHVSNINSPTGSVNNYHSYFQTHDHESYLFPVHNQQQTGSGAGVGVGGGNLGYTQGFCFSQELSNMVQIQDYPSSSTIIGPCTSLLLSEITNSVSPKKDHKTMNKMLMNDNHPPITESIGLSFPFSVLTTASSSTLTVPSTINHVPAGVGESSVEGSSETPIVATRSSSSSSSSVTTTMVFINDVAFEVGGGSFNVREAFGNEVILIHSSGQPVLIDEWGVTLQPLNHGGFYYLVPISMTHQYPC